MDQADLVGLHESSGHAVEHVKGALGGLGTPTATLSRNVRRGGLGTKAAQAMKLYEVARIRSSPAVRPAAGTNP